MIDFFRKVLPQIVSSIAYVLGFFCFSEKSIAAFPELPVVQAALESHVHREWGKHRTKERLELWDFESKEAIVKYVEMEIAEGSHPEDLYQVRDRCSIQFLSDFPESPQRRVRKSPLHSPLSGESEIDPPSSRFLEN